MIYTLLLAALLAGTAGAPSVEQVFKKIATDPVPSCEAGHAEALTSGILTIKPDQIICTSVESRGDSIVPVAVVSAYKPETTLVIKFWREPNSGDMYLVVFNPLGGFLQYQAAMRLPGSLLPQHTSTCPVLSHRRGIERWPQPVEELVLSNFKLLPESESVSCQ